MTSPSRHPVLAEAAARIEKAWHARYDAGDTDPHSPARDAFAQIQQILRDLDTEAEGRIEWVATDTTSVELGQWPTGAHVHPTRTAAENEFVGDGDDVLLHRHVTDWQITPARRTDEDR